MKNTWTFEEARSRLREIADEAVRNGPQHIARDGCPAVVIISEETYLQLRPAKSIGAFFADSPLRGLDLERAKDVPRELDL